MSHVKLLEIDADIAGQRVDNYLLAQLKGVPKSLIYRILRKGEVRVNKRRIKPDYKLQAGDVVRIPPVRVSEQPSQPRPSDTLARLLNSSVLYEDQDMLVVNKPAGLAVHGGSGVNLGLIESLRQLREDKFLELVHRLDRDTSGCVMIARNRRCLRHLQQQLREGQMNKEYLALVAGRWPKRRHQVNVPLLKNQLASGERIVRAVGSDSEGAKSSLTHYEVVNVYQGCTLVSARPVTGRTHQIRVHCQYAGYPILGDEKYSQREQLQFARDIGLKRLFLHARGLTFTLLSEKTLTVESPLANELQTVIDQLG